MYHDLWKKSTDTIFLVTFLEELHVFLFVSLVREVYHDLWQEPMDTSFLVSLQRIIKHQTLFKLNFFLCLIYLKYQRESYYTKESFLSP